MASATSSVLDVDPQNEYAYVVLLPDDDPEKPIRWKELGYFFERRYDLLHEAGELDSAISAHADSVRLTADGHPNKPGFLHNLGASSYRRFVLLQNLDDVDNAIRALEDALRLAPDGHPDKFGYLNDLGASFSSRFDRLGNMTDMNKSIQAVEGAVRLVPDGHHEKPGCLHNLGTSFQRQFERLGNVDDIQKAVRALEHAVRLTPDDDPERPNYLSNLGGSLLRRFEYFGDLNDINMSISLREKAVQLTPDGDPDKPLYLSHLGTSLLGRFEHLGNLSDIDKSIRALEDAVRLIPYGHPDKPVNLTNLGSSFARRFEHLGNPGDIDKSIKALKNAAQLIPDGHPHKPGCLSNLGGSYIHRFKLLGKLDDIDQSIQALNDALRLSADGHPSKPSYLSNLGGSYTRRFELLGELDDIDKSIQLLNDAIRLTPNAHSDNIARLGNLGGSFKHRFERLGDIDDINKSVQLREAAVKSTPDEHPDLPRHLSNLGTSLMSRFASFGDQADLNAATFHFSRAARSSSGSPRVRFHNASLWAKCCLATSASSSLEAYTCALDLLTRVAWLGLPIAERHRELTEFGGVVRDAAAAAIESEEYDTALEWLEQGRSIVWGQLLNLRTPVDDLRLRNPVLANRLEEISKKLEHASTRDISIEVAHQQSTEGAHQQSMDGAHQQSMEEVSQKHHQLAEEYDRLVEEIRARPGFEDFLKPRKFSQLSSAARSGPVVVLNVHSSRCDALILMADLDEVVHIPLNNFSYSQAEELQQSLGNLLSGRGLRARSGRDPERADAPSDDSQFMEILSDVWLNVVKPVLESLAFSVMSRTEDPPRIWWCPTGPLTFLPIHAAGHYEISERGHKISDFVVSSYTPTLTALLDTPRTKSADEFQLLAIAQPSTPGQSSLPNTTQELTNIRKHADHLRILSLEGADATVKRVIEGMGKCGWIHLACHGTQNVNDPTKSAFLLQDGLLELSEIIKSSLPDAEFAFLSACKTATGDKRLSEEAVHLAAGMLLAGYRGVVATTWSIMDNDAPLIADEVYSRLFKDNQPDGTQAALALHHAVQQLREHTHVSIFSWVPFIHVGM